MAKTSDHRKRNIHNGALALIGRRSYRHPGNGRCFGDVAGSQCEKYSTTDERLALRQSEAKAIWNSLGEWLAGPTAKDILPKSRFGQALGYLRNQWDALQLYLADGRMPIDNNDVEQLMKQVALGRKNWLFVGSSAAGDRAADFMTLVASAVRNDLDVWAYLKDVLDRLLAGETDYEPLRPDIWRESHVRSHPPIPRKRTPRQSRPQTSPPRSPPTSPRKSQRLERMVLVGAYGRLREYQSQRENNC